ncbi:DUF2508 family protein [Lacticaseibacillus songhuajiangensis]|jgi:hypothetical protein|uniref:DUF2508 family protein n=1 Tax=Lacticaseibacillus songhuajiangensis TaxID=1296539 RepID=UPI000F77115A|nr:DUF2508 family protein [Lacticaseibacillus songhuajiangensis]MCI1284328.1 YaaL family protein [Lacticaseibacillus songhuajiangensis]
MFGHKKKSQRQLADDELLTMIYAVRDDLAKERRLLNVAADAENERQKQRVALQEGLFDFLHRQARTRAVAPTQVEAFSVLHNLERIN